MTPKLQLTLQRPRRLVAQLRRAQLRDHDCDGPADGEQPRACRTSPTTRSARARRSCIRATDRVSVWGSVSKGFRAPTLNELYRQFRVGADPDAGQRGSRAGAAHRRRGGRERCAHRSRDAFAARSSTTASRIRLPTSRRTRPAQCGSARTSAARTSAASRPTCRIASTDTGACQAAYVFDIAKVHEATTDAAGVESHRQVPRRSAEAPRLVPGDVHAPALFESGAREPVRRPPVRRRPEHCADSAERDRTRREIGLPAYGVTNITASRTVNRHLDVFFRRAEPVRDSLLRGHKPDDDRDAEVGERGNTTASGTLVVDTS